MTLPTRIKENWPILAILITALILRFIGFWDFSLSNDELSALHRLNFDTFKQLVSGGFYVDGHPGGIQVFLFYWVKLFGNSPFSVRLPFVVTGVLAVLFIFKIGKAWFSEAAGLFAAALLATLQFPVLYSRIARPYGSGLFFILLLVFIWSQLLHASSKDKVLKYSILYAFANAFCMYNHYFSFLMAFIIGITGLFLVNKKNKWGYLLGAAGAALLFSPHIPITLNHLSIGGVGEWLSIPTPTWILSHILYIFNESVLLLSLITIILVITAIISKRKKGIATYRWILLIWFLMPAVIGYFYSTMVNPVLQHSVLIFSMPFFLLFLASFVGDIQKKYIALFLFFMLIPTTIHTVYVKDFYHHQFFNEFKDVASETERLTNIYGQNNITYGISINHKYYISYYFDNDFDVDYIMEDNRGKEDILTLRDHLQQITTPYFLYSWTKPIPAETDLVIRDEFPYIVSQTEYSGLSSITLYSKSAYDSKVQVPIPDTLICYDKVKKKNYSQDNYNKEACTLVMSIDDGMKYSGGIRFTPEISTSTTSIITFVAMADIITHSETDGIQLVMSIDNQQNETKYWFSSPAKDYTISGCRNNIWLSRTFTVNELEQGDYINVYVYNPEGGFFDIYNLELEMYED